jgi:hypothetical protein
MCIQQYILFTVVILHIQLPVTHGDKNRLFLSRRDTDVFLA